MKFFGMGGFELVIILVVILLIFGPKNLPKLGNALGKTVSNLRSGMNEGKKKKDEEAEKSQSPETDEAPTAQPAEIEGEVVESEDAPVETDEVVEAGVTDAADDVEAGDVAIDDDVEPDIATDSGDAQPEAAPVEEGQSNAAAPKKVRRVVKKKVAE